MFASVDQALAVAGPNVTEANASNVITINATHHVEIHVNVIVTGQGVGWHGPPTAVVDVSTWENTSNSFGLALGVDGVVVFRSLGGPAMDVLVNSTMLLLAAVLCGIGFSTMGMPCHPSVGAPPHACHPGGAPSHESLQHGGLT